MKTMLDLWAKERCPVVNGIYYGDDNVIVMEYISSCPPRPVARTKLSSILNLGPWMTTLNSLFRFDDELLKIHVQCGEGSDGSEGFVCVESLSDGKLIWLAYFENSNPFMHACVESDTIIATTNRKQVWRFPIKHPEFVKASPIPPGW